MRIRLASSLSMAALVAAACSAPPAADEPATANAPAPDPIQSTTAPAVGGPAELPTDGGVTPAPDAVAGASARDVAAPVSPAEAAVRSGGEQNQP